MEKLSGSEETKTEMMKVINVYCTTSVEEDSYMFNEQPCRKMRELTWHSTILGDKIRQLDQTHSDGLTKHQRLQSSIMVRGKAVSA